MVGRASRTERVRTIKRNIKALASIVGHELSALNFLFALCWDFALSLTSNLFPCRMIFIAIYFRKLLNFAGKRAKYIIGEDIHLHLLLLGGRTLLNVTHLYRWMMKTFFFTTLPRRTSLGSLFLRVFRLYLFMSPCLRLTLALKILLIIFERINICKLAALIGLFCRLHNWNSILFFWWLSCAVCDIHNWLLQFLCKTW